MKRFGPPMIDRRLKRLQTRREIERAALDEQGIYRGQWYAYTVGNPDTYEPELDRGPIYKQPGGILFERIEDASACVADGRLPARWFPEEDGLPPPPRQGCVYQLVVPDAICLASVPWEEAWPNARKLLLEARVRRVPPEVKVTR